MKKITFETTNSIGHIELPDIEVNEVEPLIYPTVPKQNATEKLLQRDIANDNESIFPLAFGGAIIKPEKTDEE